MGMRSVIPGEANSKPVLFSQDIQDHKLNLQKQVKRFVKTSVLGLVLTATWLTSFTAIYTKLPELWYAFFVFHGLQVHSAFQCSKVARNYLRVYRQLLT